MFNNAHFLSYVLPAPEPEPFSEIVKRNVEKDPESSSG